MSTDRVLGIDIGGTRLRVASALAATTSLDDIDVLVDEPTPPSLEDVGHIVGTTVPKVRRLGAIVGMGVAVPGLVEGTTARWVPNVPYLDDIDLEMLLSSPDPDLGSWTVAVGNDAQLALVAEATDGAARDVGDAILLSIGTGVGSAVMADRRLIRGSQGGACSFGWAADENSFLEDRPRGTGSFEHRVAGRAFDRAAAVLGFVDGRALVEAARAGHAEAIETTGSIAAALGVALAGPVAMLDPDAVVLSGSVADAFDVLVDDVQASLVVSLPPHMAGIEVRPGQFRGGTSLRGAIAAARRPRWWELPPKGSPR